MFCSSCGKPIAPTDARCPSCGSKASSPIDPSALVVVLETTEASRLAIAKSLLDGAEIPYLAQDENVSGLFPLGAFGGGFFGRSASARLHVAPEHAEDPQAIQRWSGLLSKKS